MLDTMTLTKVAGALCGALLVFLLMGWLAESIFMREGGHGDTAEQAYVIETASAGGDAETATDVAEVDFAAMVAETDPKAGEKVFGKCKACHKVDGSNATGPHLNGVVNRPVASVADFGYSDAIKAMADKTWTPEMMNQFLTDPKGFISGTKMGFAGLKDIKDRAAVVAYLSTTQG